jgi:hypothetical protein
MLVTTGIARAVAEVDIGRGGEGPEAEGVDDDHWPPRRAERALLPEVSAWARFLAD